MVDSELLEEEYYELLYGLDTETAEKLRKLVGSLRENLKALPEYVEIDVDEWGNPIYQLIIKGDKNGSSTLTEKLVTEKNDLTVIDTDRRLLGILNDKYDLRTVCGLGTGRCADLYVQRYLLVLSC